MRKTQVVLLDDIDGSEAKDSVTFAVNGVTYELDLNEEHLAEFDKALDPWVSHGRRVGGRSTGRRPRSTARTGGSDAARIRKWALQKGLKVSDRGRVPATIREQYYSENA